MPHVQIVTNLNHGMNHYFIGAGGAIPSPVTNLAVYYQSATEVLLTWNASTNAFIYAVERSPTGSSDWEILDYTTSLTFTDNDYGGVTNYYRIRGIGEGGSGQYSPIVSGPWGLHDQYTNGPLVSPRTCEPGPGTLTRVDTAGKFSISAGQLVRASGAGDGTEARMYATSGLLRTAGGVLLQRVVNYQSGGNAVVMFGYATAAGGDPVNSIRLSGTNLQVRVNSSTITVGAVANGQTYDLMMVQRAAGEFYYIKGGAFTNWTLIHVSKGSNLATVYPSIGIPSAVTSQQTFDNWRHTIFGGGFLTQHGIATSAIPGSVSEGQTFTHTADGLCSFTVTTRPSAGSIKIRFRIQDSTNYWECEINSSGDLLLNEIIAGAPTNRASNLAAIVNGDRVVIQFSGTTIRSFEGIPTGGQTGRWNYAAAANFVTETDGELNTLGTGGVVNDMAFWPQDGSAIIPGGL